MLRNYLITAWRNLLRNKVHSCINIFGLSLAIGCCLLIALFVWHEVTYDGFHEKGDRIYRLYTVDSKDLWGTYSDHVNLDMGPALKKQYPGIEHAVRLNMYPGEVESEGIVIADQWSFFANPAFLEVFTFPLLQGEPATALDGRRSVVLTASAAKRYFGTEEVLGKKLTVTFREPYDFTVTGIVGDIPENSSLRFDLLFPNAIAEEMGVGSNWSGMCNGYILLEEGKERGDIEKHLPDFIDRYMREYYSDFVEHRKGDMSTYELRLQPLRDIHFDTRLSSTNSGGINSSAAYSYILASIGLLILAIACINFTNLSIGRASTRAREIGVRKVVGAGRRQLMRQFWGEAVLLSLIALAIGLALSEILLPTFNSIVQRKLDIDYVTFLPVSMLLALAVGLLAGAYPALMMSNFRPVAVLRNVFKVGGGNSFSRGLLVAQFCLSIGLVVGTLVMEGQLHYMKTKDMGFDDEHLVCVYTEGDPVYQTMKNELELHHAILGITGSYPGPGPWGKGAPGRFQHAGEAIRFYRFYVDHNFVETLKIKLAAGRDFNRQFATDPTDAVIINEAMAARLGWDNPVGRELSGVGQAPHANPTIVGVVEDFHYSSLHGKVQPIVLFANFPGTSVTLTARISSDNVPATIALLRETAGRMEIDHGFHYYFADEAFDSLYRKEERWGRIVTYTTVLAVVISCMGLFGLVTLAVSRRTKEVGIRKVLGATVGQIVVLLSKEFTWLVLAASVIAWPVAHYAVTQWLENFAYRMELDWDVFVVGGGLALALAWLTVSYQAVKAALINPVEALRYE